MEKPYLRKLQEVGDFEVWEVDGMFVRNNLNREFTNFGQHYRFPFIPKHQFWVDKENAPGELPFYVDHMLTEWHLMADGVDYDTAITKADARELRERKKSGLMEKVRKELSRPSQTRRDEPHDNIKPHEMPDQETSKKPTAKQKSVLPKNTKESLPKELHRHKLADTKNLQIWVVNGELVRDLFFIDFTEGGHHFVYDFVPYNEVWLDDDLIPAEREFVLLHELHERYLMFKGKDYFSAHNSSSYIEYQCRKNPKLLAEKMDEEMTKNSKVVLETVSALV